MKVVILADEAPVLGPQSTLIVFPLLEMSCIAEDLTRVWVHSGLHVHNPP